MAKAIIITGTPGTGKTHLAKDIAKRYGLPLIDVGKFARDNGLVESYDEARDSAVVDEKKLAEALGKMLREDRKTPYILLDGHLSHFLAPSRVALCIVTNADLPALKERLTERGYGAAKVRENLDAEIFQVCRTEAEARGHRVYVLDTLDKGALEALYAEIGRLRAP